MRSLGITLIAGAHLLVPSTAFASERSAASEPVSVVVGMVTLLAAVALLLVALGLARVVRGSAVAENITFVVAACACLAASVLASWAARVLPDAFSSDQARLGADLLIIAAIAFFCVYFWRVLTSLKRFLSVLSSPEALARAQGAFEEGPDSIQDSNGGADA